MRYIKLFEQFVETINEASSPINSFVIKFKGNQEELTAKDLAGVKSDLDDDNCNIQELIDQALEDLGYGPDDYERYRILSTDQGKVKPKEEISMLNQLAIQLGVKQLHESYATGFDLEETYEIEEAIMFIEEHFEYISEASNDKKQADYALSNKGQSASAASLIKQTLGWALFPEISRLNSEQDIAAKKLSLIHI
jgi:hypothetical protein